MAYTRLGSEYLLGSGGYNNTTPYAGALSGGSGSTSSDYPYANTAYERGVTTQASSVADSGIDPDLIRATNRTTSRTAGTGTRDRRSGGTRDRRSADRNRRRRRRSGRNAGANREAAIRDVNLALNAQIDAINREQQQAYRDYLNRVNGANAAYGGFNQTVGAMMSPYVGQTANVMSSLNSALAPYQNAQGNVLGLDPSEYTAGQGSFNTAAAAAQGLLGSMGQRGVDYLTGAQTEGALAQRYAQDNLLQGWEDAQNQYAQLRLDATDHSGDYILQRLDELKNQALQNSAIKQQISSNSAYSDMLANLIKSMGV